MKKTLLFSISLVLFSLLIVQCAQEDFSTKVELLETEEGDITKLTLEEGEPNEPSNLALKECSVGGVAKDTLDLSNIILSSLIGKKASDFLKCIDWGEPKRLCKGDCITGECLPTSIESTTSSDLQIETDNNGTNLITDAKWRNTNVNIKKIIVKLRADKCECE